MSLIDAADRIMNKANKSGLVGVMVIGGKVKTFSGQLFNETLASAVRADFSRLLSVYDKHAAIEWIEEDLVWAEKHMVGVNG